MNPKNPQAASEGFVRIRESVVRHWVRELNTARNCDSPAGDICERLHSSILAALSVLATEPAAPALTPAGNALTGKMMVAAQESLQSNGVDLPGRVIREAITAALAPAAQQEGAVRAATREEEAEIDEAAELTKVAFRMPDDLLGVVDAQAAREGLIRVAMIRTLIKRGLSSENVVAPADPPAAGDGLLVDVIEAARRVIDCPPLRVMDLLESISSLRHALAAAEAGSAALNAACASVEERADRVMCVLKQCRPFVAYAFDQGIVGAEDAGRALDALLASQEAAK